jgi:hypothetical protein
MTPANPLRAYGIFVSTTIIVIFFISIFLLVLNFQHQ